MPYVISQELSKKYFCCFIRAFIFCSHTNDLSVSCVICTDKLSNYLSSAQVRPDGSSRLDQAIRHY